MKKLAFTVIYIGIFQLIHGQTNHYTAFIELGKLHNNFMFRVNPSKGDLSYFKNGIPGDLKSAGLFIEQTIIPKSSILSKQFLSRPDNQTLQQLYIIHAISLNMGKENQLENKLLIDSLQKTEIPTYELVDNYYSMLFTAVGNKLQPFNLSKVNLELNEYKLQDDSEKGILFLHCMRLCNRVIWGYMNIVNPPNTKEAWAKIKKYPKVNGKPYFQYTNLHFPDFDIVISEDEGKQSYKSYYLDSYFETLIFHLVCLIKEVNNEDAKRDLLLGSILRSENLYQYTKYSDFLREIFTTK